MNQDYDLEVREFLNFVNLRYPMREQSHLYLEFWKTLPQHERERYVSSRPVGQVIGAIFQHFGEKQYRRRLYAEAFYRWYKARVTK